MTSRWESRRQSAPLFRTRSCHFIFSVCVISCYSLSGSRQRGKYTEQELVERATR